MSLNGESTRNGKEVAQDLEMIYGFFPRLRQRRKAQAGYVSRGEQQTVAVGRAMISRPKIMVLDEASPPLSGPRLSHGITKPGRT